MDAALAAFANTLERVVRADHRRNCRRRDALSLNGPDPPDQPMLYASARLGSLGHLSTERFLNQAGLQMVHVPYRGQAPTTLAIFAGEVDIC
jgi:hypothetical protein